MDKLNKHSLPTTILLVLVAVLLLGAIGSWPYVYYELLRWVVCGVGAYGAFVAYESERTVWVWMFGIIAVLFNPIAPFYMQRETWQILDLAGAVLFLTFPFTEQLADKINKLPESRLKTTLEVLFGSVVFFGLMGLMLFAAAFT